MVVVRSDVDQGGWKAKVYLVCSFCLRDSVYQLDALLCEIGD